MGIRIKAGCSRIFIEFFSSKNLFWFGYRILKLSGYWISSWFIMPDIIYPAGYPVICWISSIGQISGRRLDIQYEKSVGYPISGQKSIRPNPSFELLWSLVYLVLYRFYICSNFTTGVYMFFSSVALKLIYICWIRTVSQPYWNI